MTDIYNKKIKKIADDLLNDKIKEYAKDLDESLYKLDLSKII